jgi:hypothetical protein
MEAIETLNLTILAHVPYGADLVPSNFHLFSKTKEDLRGHVCDSIEEVERAVRTWMKKQSMEFLHGSFQKRFLHWRKCVENNVDYVEK